MSIVLENVEKLMLKNEYVRVKSESGDFFGGSQMWYGKGGKKSLFESFKKENRIRGYGCGLVAANDILLYLEYKRDWASKTTVISYDRDKKELVQESGEEDTEATKEGKVTSLNWKEKDYTDRLFEMEKKWFHILPVAGINGVSLAFKFSRYCRKNGLSYKAKWGCGELSIPDAIMEMLENDLPVLLAIGPGWGKKDRLTFYGCTDIGSKLRFDEMNSTKDHYVTITGAVCGKISEGSRNIPDSLKKKKRKKLGINPGEENGEVLFLEISSWGKKYYLDYEEYAAYVIANDNTLFSNILYISPRA